MRGLMPVLVIPLLATLISGFIMVVGLGKPLAALMEALSDGLNSLQGGSAIVLGIIGAVAKGLLYLLVIGVVVFVGALLLSAVRFRRGGRRPVR